MEHGDGDCVRLIEEKDDEKINKIKNITYFGTRWKIATMIMVIWCERVVDLGVVSVATISLICIFP